MCQHCQSIPIYKQSCNNCLHDCKFNPPRWCGAYKPEVSHLTAEEEQKVEAAIEEIWKEIEK